MRSNGSRRFCGRRYVYGESSREWRLPSRHVNVSWSRNGVTALFHHGLLSYQPLFVTIIITVIIVVSLRYAAVVTLLFIITYAITAVYVIEYVIVDYDI